ISTGIRMANPTITINPHEIATAVFSFFAPAVLGMRTAVPTAGAAEAAAATPAPPPAGTRNVFMHPGHLAIFPARSSGTFNRFPHVPQTTEIGIVLSVPIKYRENNYPKAPCL